MLFATFFPIGAGIAISALFFTLAGTLGWSGIAMMRIFYVSIVTTALLLAMIKPRRPRWEVGE
jgi:hypothetical protein